MKILFCTFLSIFAFSSVANATADTENFDSEVTAAFSSSRSTTLIDSSVSQILPGRVIRRHFLRQILAELYVNLSAHTAPIRQTLDLIHGSSD